MIYTTDYDKEEEQKIQEEFAARLFAVIKTIEENKEDKNEL